MTVPLDAVIRALRSYPNGVTTSDLARHLGMKPRSLSGRLGKVWMHGGPIDRNFGVRGRHVHAESIWRAKSA